MTRNLIGAVYRFRDAVLVEEKKGDFANAGLECACITWFGEGPEVSLLRTLGLFDRLADEKALGVVLKSPAIPGLTESLADLSPTEWSALLARLRRARLLAGADAQNPGHLDMHPDYIHSNRGRRGREIDNATEAFVDATRMSQDA